MATGRVLKNLFVVAALVGAMLVAAPVAARDRDHEHHGGYGQYDRQDGHGWRGHGRGHGDGGWRGHGGHGWQQHRGWGGNHWNGHHGRGHGWGHYPPAYYGPRYHRHYRGCGHDGYYQRGYYQGGLVEFLIDYSRYDD